MLDLRNLSKKLLAQRGLVDEVSVKSSMREEHKQLGNQVRVATQGVTNISDSIAKALRVSRHYIADDNSYDPRFLVFEFVRSVILRKGQVSIVRGFCEAVLGETGEHNLHMIATAPEKQDSCHMLAQQMLMGQGKTAIITPLLCLMLSNGEMLPIVLLPDSLLEAGRTIVRSTFSNIVHKLVCSLIVTRATSADSRLVNMLTDAREQKGIVVTTPSSVKSSILKFIEGLMMLSQDAADRANVDSLPPNTKLLTKRKRVALQLETTMWSELLRHFENSVLVMDELDWVTHPMKSELNFPCAHAEAALEETQHMRAAQSARNPDTHRSYPLCYAVGAREPLDFGQTHQGKRWECALHLFDALFGHETQTPPASLRDDKTAYEILRRLCEVTQRGYQRDCLQRQPHMVLLDLGFYRQDMLPVLIDWVLLFLQMEQFGRIALSEVDFDTLQTLLRTHLGGKKLESHSENLLVRCLSHGEWKLLNLMEAWLHTLLPYCVYAGLDPSTTRG